MVLIHVLCGIMYDFIQIPKWSGILSERGTIKKGSQSLTFDLNLFSIALQFNRTERLGGEANYQGADCIRVIMIFTDGGTSSEEAIFAARNRYPFKVRRELDAACKYRLAWWCRYTVESFSGLLNPPSLSHGASASLLYKERVVLGIWEKEVVS